MGNVTAFCLYMIFLSPMQHPISSELFTSSFLNSDSQDFTFLSDLTTKPLTLYMCPLLSGARASQAVSHHKMSLLNWSFSISFSNRSAVTLTTSVSLTFYPIKFQLHLLLKVLSVLVVWFIIFRRNMKLQQDPAESDWDNQPKSCSRGGLERASNSHLCNVVPL